MSARNSPAEVIRHRGLLGPAHVEDLTAFIQAGYRAITIDACGFGDTSAKWDDFSARAVGRDAVAVLRHLRAVQATIFGN